MSQAPRAALVLFAHGARDPGWADPLRAIQAAVAAARPDLRVELAFLELMTPRLEECVEALAAAGHAAVTVAPLFLAMGGHLRNDLPRLVERIAARHPHLRLTLLPPLGEAAVLREAMSAWLAATTPH